MITHLVEREELLHRVKNYIEMTENKVKKELFVGRSVKSIDLDKMEITFKLTDHVVPETKKIAENLLSKLIEQNTNFFSDIPVRGLSLHWNEVINEKQ